MNDKGYVFFKLWAIKLSLKNAFLERPSRTGGATGSGAYPAPDHQLPGVGRKPEEKGRHRPEAVRPSRRAVGSPPKILGQPSGGHQTGRRGPGLHGETDDRLRGEGLSLWRG